MGRDDLAWKRGHRDDRVDILDGAHHSLVDTSTLNDLHQSPRRRHQHLVVVPSDQRAHLRRCASPTPTHAHAQPSSPTSPTTGTDSSGVIHRPQLSNLRHDQQQTIRVIADEELGVNAIDGEGALRRLNRHGD